VRAIILAAGQGLRLKPLTDDVPKCLVPFRGRPILDRMLEALRAAAITDVAAVTGYRGGTLRDHGLTLRHNPDYASTNMVHSLFCAEDLLGGDDLLVVYGDVLIRPALLRRFCEYEAPLTVAINTKWRELWSLRMENPLADAETLKLDGDGCIRELGKKAFSYSEIEGQYMGLIRIAHDALPRVVDFYRSMDRTKRYDGKDFRNMYMTSFLQMIIDDLMPIRAVPLEGGWLEIDTLADLAAYERLPADFLD
jgi:L-glutamine-phosphate cytidylyltransferase